MCVSARKYVTPGASVTITTHICVMEYPLPGPVVALLQQERASMTPKSYFISSGKKSIKITLVYAKGEEPPESASSSSRERKKSRHVASSKPPPPPPSKATPRRTRSKNLSESSSSTGSDQPSGSSPPSDADQPSSSPELPLQEEHHTGQEEHHTGRERMSTVDSGHPSSSGTVGHDNYPQTESGSDDEEECGSGSSSSECEKPRTPGRDIAVPASSVGPGETPSARRDEIWQTWTRIPRTQALTRRLLAPPITSVRRSLSPSTGPVQRNVTPSASQRRPRLHEGVSWDGSGNL